MKRTRLWTGLSVLVLAIALMRAPPAYAVDITVTTTDDVLDAAAGCAAVTVLSLPGPDGVTSLREAMCAANNNSVSDTIDFDISGCGGVCTIQPTIALPFLTGDGTTIDGYTQDSAAEATAGTPATLLIEIDGSGVLNHNGLNVVSAGNVIRGLVINRFGVNGIVIIGGSATGNVISGNHIGTDAAGTADLGNGFDGVFIGLGAQDNTVGGDTPADRNVISGNDLDGVAIHRSDTVSNTVRGNYIGTDASGSLNRGNASHGVYVYGGTHDNTVGPDNVISGNDEGGVRIYGTDTTSNTITGNTIGLAADGTAGLGNGDDGVYIANGAHDNTIGPGNVISGNDSDGVAIYDSGTTGNVVSGNAIGVDESGTLDRGNAWDGIIIGSGAQDNTVGPDNVISGNDGDGVRIVDSSTMSNTVSGNLIGIDGSGAVDLGNTGHGVFIGWGAQDNMIGPDSVISGNGEHGVFVSEDGTTGNVVSGNIIGADATGAIDLGNTSSGVHVGYGAQGNTIGPENVISGNDEYGVSVNSSDTVSNTISGNLIGTDATGTLDLGNAWSGVRIWGGAQDNTVGPGNTISGNDRVGVDIEDTGTTGNVVWGNHIGTDADGTSSVGNPSSGVRIWDGAQDNAVGPDNTISGNGQNGVQITGSDTMGNIIVGNLIGTDPGGTAGVGNNWNGIQLSSGARNNTIGPDNVISGNDLDGVFLIDGETTGNAVSGNYIGTDGSGTADLGNSHTGVAILRAPGNTIGPDNVISGNDRYGVYMYDAGTTGNTVSRNYIGTAADGVTALGNAEHGVYFYVGAQDNTVGPDNVIAHNGGDGVRVGGASTTGNAITQNSIFANTMGIDLFDGANGSIAPPEILTTTRGSVHVVGTACPGCTVELFRNSDTDGEGETYVGDDTADAGGAFSVTVTYLNDPYLTATATDAVSGTSEFSAVFTATETGHRSIYLPVTLRNR
jgi:hypothetical protein